MSALPGYTRCRAAALPPPEARSQPHAPCGTLGWDIATAGALLREAGLDGGFVRHRGLIAFAAGGAMAEAVLLTFLAPGARPLAPQVTALPPLAAYHDVRWLFAFNQRTS